MSTVLKIDLSNALPPRPYLYFSAFLPGLFFVVSVLLANPDIASQLTFASREGFGFGRYFTLFLCLFYAFVIGNGFMLFIALIQFTMGYVYRSVWFLWEQWLKQVILPFLTRLTHVQPRGPSPTPAPPTVRSKFVNALYIWSNSKVNRIPAAKTPEYVWWDVFVRQLLLKRCGLSDEKLPGVSFGPLQQVLTAPSLEDIRGSALVNALQATGWAALLACRLAPSLRTKWYMVLAIFLIGYGLFHALSVAARLYDPDIGDLLRLQAVLREFPKIQRSGINQPVDAAEHEGEDRP